MMSTTPSAPTDHYTIISADCHAGGSHAQYREYLTAEYQEQFDAWRDKYRNPYKDLAPGDDRRLRNWDSEMRNGQQEQDGVVGEVIFPNTVPPFFPSFVLFAPPPKAEEYELRRVGIQAHNRWLKDFCDEYPERRAGVGQIFLNDIDDAIEDAIWIKENGLRGGVMIPNIPPDVKWVRPVYDPEYDRLWKVLEDLEIPVNAHGGTGVPDYGPYERSMLFYIADAGVLLAATVPALRPRRHLREVPATEVHHDGVRLRLAARAAQEPRRHRQERARRRHRRVALHRRGEEGGQGAAFGDCGSRTAGWA